MTRGKRIVSLAIVVASAGTLLLAQQPAPPAGAPAAGLPGREQLPQPVFRVAQQPPQAQPPQAQPQQPQQQQPAYVANNPAGATPGAATGAVPGAAGVQGHPLDPALEMAAAALANIEKNVRDYSCNMYKRERIDNKVGETECMFVKIRHEPFSVYTHFLHPSALKGQEALYVEGRNNGNLLGHGVGVKRLVGTVPLQPTGSLAMAGQRYPITEIGILNLTRRLVDVAKKDRMYGECEVQFFQNTKIKIGANVQNVTCIQVVHPVPRKNFTFHLAKVYVDTQLNMPVRYESYDWPTTPGGQPLLLEEYTYTDIKINNGFTDADFDEHNSKYNFH